MRTGARLASRRLPEGLTGSGSCTPLIAAHAEEPNEVVVGIEKDHGLWVDALTRPGLSGVAINPMAVARYRDRHHISGAKSDAATPSCWPIWCAPIGTITVRSPATAMPAEAIKVLARAHQNLIWTRSPTGHHGLRAGLCEYYPAALEAFEDLADRDRDWRSLAVHPPPPRCTAEPAQDRSALKAADANATSINAPTTDSGNAAQPSSSPRPPRSPPRTGPPPELRSAYRRTQPSDRRPRSRTRDTF